MSNEQRNFGFSTPYAAKHANERSEFKFDERGVLIVSDAALLFTNFAGRDRFSRSFNLVLSDAMAKQLSEDGWYVKSSQNQDGDATYYINISVGDKDEKYCPSIITYAEFNGRRSRTVLTFADMGDLDDGRWENIKVAIYPRERTDDKYGRYKGYLRELRCVAVPNHASYFDDMDEAYGEHPRDSEEDYLPFN